MWFPKSYKKSNSVAENSVNIYNLSNQLHLPSHHGGEVRESEGWKKTKPCEKSRKRNRSSPSFVPLNSTKFNSINPPVNSFMKKATTPGSLKVKKEKDYDRKLKSKINPSLQDPQDLLLSHPPLSMYNTSPHLPPDEYTRNCHTITQITRSCNTHFYFIHHSLLPIYLTYNDNLTSD